MFWGSGSVDISHFRVWIPQEGEEDTPLFFKLYINFPHTPAGAVVDVYFEDGYFIAVFKYEIIKNIRM